MLSPRYVLDLVKVLNRRSLQVQFGGTFHSCSVGLWSWKRMNEREESSWNERKDDWQGEYNCFEITYGVSCDPLSCKPEATFLGCSATGRLLWKWWLLPSVFVATKPSMQRKVLIMNSIDVDWVIVSNSNDAFGSISNHQDRSGGIENYRLLFQNITRQR